MKKEKGIPFLYSRIAFMVAFLLFTLSLCACVPEKQNAAIKSTADNLPNELPASATATDILSDFSQIQTSTISPFWSNVITQIPLVDEKWEYYDIYKPPISEEENTSLIRITSDPDGNIWLGLSNGVTKYTGLAWGKNQINIPEINFNIDKFVVSTGDKVWISTYTNDLQPRNLLFFNGVEWIEEYENIKVNQIILGEGDDTWFALAPIPGGNEYGPQVGGVLRNDGNKWTLYTKEEGLLSNRVTSGVMDRSGRMWFSTDIGISMFNGSNWTNYPNIIGNLEYDPFSDNLWVISDGSISIFTGEEITTYEIVKDYFPGCVAFFPEIGKIEDVKFLAKETAWVFVKGCGIIKYWHGNWMDYSFPYELGQITYEPEQFCIAPNEKIWISKGTSLYSFSEEEVFWTKIDVFEGDDFATSIVCSNDGSIWMGSILGKITRYFP